MKTEAKPKQHHFQQLAKGGSLRAQLAPAQASQRAQTLAEEAATRGRKKRRLQRAFQVANQQSIMKENDIEDALATQRAIMLAATPFGFIYDSA